MVAVTERDLDLLRWINGFGFVMSGQVGRWMGVDEKVSGRRLRKLESIGVIARERVFHRGGSVVRVTKTGVQLAGDALGPMRMLRLGSFEHDRALVDLSLDILAEHKGAVFLPDRRIRHERGQGSGVGQKGHIADGFLVRSDGTTVAIELELTRKQRWRLKKIIGELQADMRLEAVWYFCAPTVVDLVREIVGGDEMFSVFAWPDHRAAVV